MNINHFFANALFINVTEDHVFIGVNMLLQNCFLQTENQARYFTTQSTSAVKMLIKLFKKIFAFVKSLFNIV